MTINEVLEKTGTEKQISSDLFYELIREFHGSYLAENNYYEKLKIHRNPIEIKNEFLRELYSYLLQIQGRDEMRHIDMEKKSSGYVPTMVMDIWRRDKRIKSLYNATRKYCELTGKNFNIIATHLAEYRAMNKVVSKIQLSIFKGHRPTQTANTNVNRVSKKNRTKIPQENKKRAELQKEISSVCPFCDNTDVGHFHIHHIDNDPSNNRTDNLLLLCPNCHSKITKGDIAEIDVRNKKSSLVTSSIPLTQRRGSINFNAKVENAIVGDNNVIKITKPKVSQKAKYPPGCIGYESIKANYISHLIGRYNEYKEYEMGKGNVKYAVFATHLKKRFKIGTTRTIFNLPSEKFNELILYIQGRIDGTKLAKIKDKNHKNYSSLEEYSKSTPK